MLQGFCGRDPLRCLKLQQPSEQIAGFGGRRLQRRRLQSLLHQVVSLGARQVGHLLLLNGAVACKEQIPQAIGTKSRVLSSERRSITPAAQRSMAARCCCCTDSLMTSGAMYMRVPHFLPSQGFSKWARKPKSKSTKGEPGFGER